MPVSTPNNQYAAQLADWQMMQHALDGEQAVKDQGTLYLPKTSGMMEAESLAGTNDSPVTPEQAREIYAGYKNRADYPIWVKDSLRTMMGMVSRLEPEIKLPRRMAALENNATADGFGLQQLFMRICSALLTKGRKPLLCDFDDTGAPYIASYTAEAAINWRSAGLGGRQDLILTVLTEQRPKDSSDEFTQETEDVFRVLDIVDGGYRVRVLRKNGDAFEEESFPGVQGSNETTPLKFIPLVFAGSTDNSADLDEIPLLTMAKAARKYYQLSADYYQSLHYTGHPQPVVKGLDDNTDLRVTGVMAAWALPADGDAYYMEFSGPGVAMTREAMQDQRNSAMEAGARVIDTQQQESGDARRARQDDQHATLHSVVMQAAEAVEQCMKYHAEWMNISPDEVSFTVDPKFSAEEIDAAMLQIVGNLVMAGESPRTVLYNALRKTGLTELSDEELDLARENPDSNDRLPPEIA